jgi:chaperonin GroEL (HSP60 family)
LCVWQYFADRDIFCAGRVTEEDLQRVAAATGGTVQTSVNNVIDEVSISHFHLVLFFISA